MICRLFTLLVTIKIVLSASTGSTDVLSNGEFTTDIFAQIIKNNEVSKNNLIFSPASIYTCLALTYFGAEDTSTTANELVTSLHFDSHSKESTAAKFENLLQVTRGPNAPIKLANKIYTNTGLEIKQEFNDIARKSFGSEAESLDFGNKAEAINKINSWIYENTNNKIKNIVDEDIISSDTKMVLVNAIYFKGNWKTPLHKRDGDFFNDGVTATKTDLMFDEGQYLYASYDDLNSIAVKMPYAGTDLSLFLILPKEKTGLSELENKLKELNLLELSKQMKIEDVAITIPKFQIETKLDLNMILQGMGLKTMFTDDAKFNFFTSSGTSKVGKVVHKAFIDVNELGTEASAATALGIVPTSLNLNQKTFYANHPFFFAIVDNSNVYFTGHVTHL